jgi:hypothetical protein
MNNTANGGLFTLKMMENNIKTYHVPKIRNFIDLTQNVCLNVHDLPGLNDSMMKNVYHEYIDKYFHKYDIIVLVIDIYSSFNTSDETYILEKILINMNNNYHKYDLQQKLIVLLNKCDEIEKDHLDNYTPMDNDLKEMYKQACDIVDTYVKKLYSDCEDVSIILISSENACVYRMIQNNPMIDIDHKHKNIIGINAHGKEKWMRFDDKKKECEIKKITSRKNFDSQIENSGFNRFREEIKCNLAKRDQFNFIKLHLIYDIKKYIENNTEFDKSNDEILIHISKLQKYNESYIWICNNFSFKPSDEFIDKYATIFLNIYGTYINDQISNKITNESKYTEFIKLKNVIFKKLYESNINSCVLFYNDNIEKINNLIFDYNESKINKCLKYDDTFDTLKELCKNDYHVINKANTINIIINKFSNIISYDEFKFDKNCYTLDELFNNDEGLMLELETLKKTFKDLIDDNTYINIIFLNTCNFINHIIENNKIENTHITMYLYLLKQYIEKYYFLCENKYKYLYDYLKNFINYHYYKYDISKIMNDIFKGEMLNDKANCNNTLIYRLMDLLILSDKLNCVNIDTVIINMKKNNSDIIDMHHKLLKIKNDTSFEVSEVKNDIIYTKKIMNDILIDTAQKLDDKIEISIVKNENIINELTNSIKIKELKKTKELNESKKTIKSNESKKTIKSNEVKKTTKKVVSNC